MQYKSHKFSLKNAFMYCNYTKKQYNKVIKNTFTYFCYKTIEMRCRDGYRR